MEELEENNNPEEVLKGNSTFEILSKLEEESDLEFLKSRMERAFSTDGDDMVGYNAGAIPKTQDYLDGSESAYGQLDLNELQAQSQSGIKKFGTMFPKIATKVVSELAKMPGTLYGLSEAALTDTTFDEAMDNSWLNAIKNAEEYINEQVMPVYVKNSVKNGDIWDNISSVDFWATEGADGIGFMASMFVPGLAIQKLGVGAKLARSMTSGAAKVMGGNDKALKAMNAIGATPKNIDLFSATMANTLFEAGSEGANAMESFKESAMQKLNNGEIGIDEFHQLMDKSSEVGRNIFTTNMGLLLLPNMISNKIVMGGAKSNMLAKDLYEKGSKSLLKELPQKSLSKKSLNFVKEFAKGYGREGYFEEGLQNATESFFTENALENQSSTIGAQFDFINGLPGAYLNTLSTTEGQKAIFLGGILGGGMNAFQSNRNNKATQKQQSSLLNSINTNLDSFNVSLTDIYKRDADGKFLKDENGERIKDPQKVSDVIEAVQDQEDINELLAVAEETNDVELANAIKHQVSAALSVPFVKEGKEGLELLRDQLEQMESLKSNIEQSNSAYGTSDTTKTFIDKVMKNAEEMQSDYEIFDEFGRSIINLDNKEASKEERNSFFKKLQDNYLLARNKERNFEELLRNKKITKEKLENTFDISKENEDDVVTDSPPHKKVVEEIAKIEDYLKQVKKESKSFWDTKQVNSLFNDLVSTRKQRDEALEKEEEAATASLEDIEKATTEEEVDEALGNTELSESTKEVISKVAEGKKNQIAKKNEEENEAVAEKVLSEEKEASSEAVSKRDMIDYIDDQVNTEIDGYNYTMQVVKDNEVYKLVHGMSMIGKDNAPLHNKEYTTEDLYNLIAEKQGFIPPKKVNEEGDTSSSDNTIKTYKSEETPPTPTKKVVKPNKVVVNKSFPDVVDGGEVNPNDNTVESNNYFNNQSGTYKKDTTTPTKDSTWKMDASRSDSKVLGIADNGNKLGFLNQDYIDYLYNGEYKVGEEVTIEVDTEFTVGKAASAIDTFNNLPKNLSTFEDIFADAMSKLDGDGTEFYTTELINMIENLPIKIITNSGGYSYISTKPDAKPGSQAMAIYAAKEKVLRTNAIMALHNKEAGSRVVSTIKFQYPGKIQSSPKIDGKIPENSLLDLFHVNTIDDIDFLFQSDDNGNLYNEKKEVVSNMFIDTSTGKVNSPLFTGGVSKKGNVYTTVPMANGKLFPLKLNTAKISQKNAELIFNLYAEVFESNVDLSILMTLDNLSESTREKLKTEHADLLDIFDTPFDDIQVSDLLAMLIHDNSGSSKYKFKIEGNSLAYGEKTVNKGNIIEFRESILNFLTKEKRTAVNVLALGGDTDINSRKYKSYLIENKLVNTDAIVNAPLFQGDANIYIDNNVKTTSKKKSNNTSNTSAPTISSEPSNNIVTTNSAGNPLPNNTGVSFRAEPNQEVRVSEEGITYGSFSKGPSGEDSIAIDSAKGVYAISDGMGGESFGIFGSGFLSTAVTNRLVKGENLEDLTFDDLLLSDTDKNIPLLVLQEIVQRFRSGVSLKETMEYVKEITSGANYIVANKITSLAVDIYSNKPMDDKLGATTIVATKEGRNTYNISKIGDTVFAVIGIDGSIKRVEGFSTNNVTDGVIWGFSNKRKDFVTFGTKTEDFTVKLEDGQRLVIASDFIETEAHLNEFIEKLDSGSLNLKEFVNKNKFDDATFTVINSDPISDGSNSVNTSTIEPGTKSLTEAGGAVSDHLWNEVIIEGLSLKEAIHYKVRVPELYGTTIEDAVDGSLIRELGTIEEAEAELENLRNFYDKVREDLIEKYRNFNPNDTINVKVVKDSNSNWNLGVRESGQVINLNTNEEVTDERLINKALLKSGFLHYQKVKVGKQEYAVTTNGQIINITKGGKSNGKTILATSSTGKAVLKQVDASAFGTEVTPTKKLENKSENNRNSESNSLPLQDIKQDLMDKNETVDNAFGFLNDVEDTQSDDFDAFGGIDTKC